MKKILVLSLILIACLLLQINTINSLEILEPIIQEIGYSNYVDIGYISADEEFLISFLLENNEDYFQINLSEDSSKIALVENTLKTKESIFTKIKIKKDVEGNKEIKLILKSKEYKDKEIIIITNIKNNTLHNLILPYKKESKINILKEINLKIFNKANSSKKIVIASDLSNYWFDEKNPKIISDLLQPNSSKILKYKVIPPIIGCTKFNIYIFNNYNYDKSLKNNLENTNNYKIEEIELDTIKTLNSIFQTKRHQLPLFGVNSLPVYFFNNIIRIL
jgi:hypothetical protein